MEYHASATLSVKIAGSHGYRIEGDLAVLNAELAVRPEAMGSRWALQLWACERPHTGGPLTGTKVAEAPIEFSTAADEPQYWRAEAPASMPAAGRDYSMVLVVASGAGAAFEQVYDFANFSERQPFFAPHLVGAVGYAIDGSTAVMRAARICNPRAADNLSGSLSLQLRACAADAPDAGVVLATAPLGRIAGQFYLEQVEESAAFSPPTAGEWRIALELVEWTGTGAVVRDACVFEVPYRSAPEARADAAAPSPSAAPAVPEGPRRVSIQTASVDELTRVQGISRRLAIEIVKARPFRSLDELVRVRGIGDKTARKLRSLLTI
jgi:hypothetical protein